MLRHVVMANFKSDVSQADREKFAREGAERLARIPGTSNVHIGLASEIQGKSRYDMALFVDFDSNAALDSYLNHPLHKAAEARNPSALSELFISNYVC